MNGWHGTVQKALDQLTDPDGKRSATCFIHGTLKVLLYAPRGSDQQIPHDRDEIYIIAKGSGTFQMGDERFDFSEGDAIFVPAKVSHRFESFTDDLATWVLFYGPTGGED
ncbi:MAG: cupin domain-containing protein [Methyloligellaceae bacterium]